MIVTITIIKKLIIKSILGWLRELEAVWTSPRCTSTGLVLFSITPIVPVFCFHWKKQRTLCLHWLIASFIISGVRAAAEGLLGRGAGDRQHGGRHQGVRVQEWILAQVVRSWINMLMMVLISMQLKKVEIYNNKMLSRLMNICCRFYYLALILSLLVAVHKDIQMCMKTYSCKQIYSKDIHAQHTKILKHTWKDIHIWRIQRYSRIQRYWNVAFTATRRWMDNFEKWRRWFLKRGNIRQLVVFVLIIEAIIVFLLIIVAIFPLFLIIEAICCFFL